VIARGGRLVRSHDHALGQLAQSIVLAAVVELPLGAVCTWLSLHTQELTERRIVLLMRGRGRPGRAGQR
jgi:hypothetical protein